jgi:diguanylate cyclase
VPKCIEPLTRTNAMALPQYLDWLPSVAASLLLLWLAAHACLDLAQRAWLRGTAERMGWLAAAAVALGTGLWAAAALGLRQVIPHPEAGIEAAWAGAAVAASLPLSLAGLWVLRTDADSRGRRVLSAALLGAATTAAPLLLLRASQAEAVQWHAGLVVLGWLVACSAFAWSVQALRASTGHSLARITLAAVIAGIGMLMAQSLVLAAPGADLAPLPPAGRVALGTLATLSSIGGAELLLLMLLACAVEARLRGRLQQAQTALQAQALRDELTGLPNRVAFETRLAQAQQRADLQHGQLAVLLVALDGFRHVNEDFGHPSGDELLRQVAQRLSALVDAGNVARLGGDEFLLLSTETKAAPAATALASRAIEAASLPCQVLGRELTVGCSVGIAVYPLHGAMSGLITHAGTALRTAKGAGGASYALFDPRMEVDLREQAELQHDLRQALARSQLELYYQPKIHAPSAQITGVEALLRWHHPQRGTISPNVFIPMAERSGLINPLGAWVIDEACRQARVWRDQGLRMRVAINVSAQQVRQPELPQTIADALRRHQINPDLLTCEITESVAMEDTEATVRFFGRLAAVGVHIAIDDFGSGYSSLAYLRKLPAGELKIDRSFVLDLEHSEEARKIAAAVVQLAQALKLKVVAEGVETEAQYQILRQLGCDELQGFLFARPMSAKALGLWALCDEGPRSMQFSESLFQQTQAVAL